MNRINDNIKKLAVFLMIVGTMIYALLSNLVAPTKPADKSYPKIKAVLRAHLNPKPLIIAERFRFH